MLALKGDSSANAALRPETKQDSNIQDNKKRKYKQQILLQLVLDRVYFSLVPSAHLQIC